MGLRIQNNVEAFNTHRQLTATGVAASKSMEKLSSGYRINRAADDAEHLTRHHAGARRACSRPLGKRGRDSG